VATASGWTPACTAHQLSAATGWAPVRVGMSEAVTGYCAVLTVQANQESMIYSPSSTGTGVDQPLMAVESGANWANGQNICSEGQPFVACDVTSTTAPGQYVLLVHPLQLPLPATLSFQGVCTFGCPGHPAVPVITSVTPAAGRAGSISKLVVHGTDLNLGVQVELASDANNVAAATPVSLSAGGTALTVLLDTHGVTPGLYDVVQFGVGYTVGTPSPGYLPGAYRVTAGLPAPPIGTFVPAVQPGSSTPARAWAERKDRCAPAAWPPSRWPGSRASRPGVSARSWRAWQRCSHPGREPSRSTRTGPPVPWSRTSASALARQAQTKS
jgi:hypothetical protein